MHLAAWGLLSKHVLLYSSAAATAAACELSNGNLALLVLRIVPERTAYVIERFGKYVKTLSPGLHFLIPVVRYCVRWLPLTLKLLY